MNEKLLKIIKREYGKRTQRNISRMSGVVTSDLSLIWNGHRKLTVETFCKLCDGIGIEAWEVWKEAGKG